MQYLIYLIVLVALSAFVYDTIKLIVLEDDIKSEYGNVNAYYVLNYPKAVKVYGVIDTVCTKDGMKKINIKKLKSFRFNLSSTKLKMKQGLVNSEYFTYLNVKNNSDTVMRLVYLNDVIISGSCDENKCWSMSSRSIDLPNVDSLEVSVISKENSCHEISFEI